MPRAGDGGGGGAWAGWAFTGIGFPGKASGQLLPGSGFGFQGLGLRVQG